MNFVLFVSCVSLATSRDRFKGVQNLGGGLFGARLLSSSLSPIGAMFHDPIKQGSFKADVFAGFFAFNPFMLQNLRALGEELLVECRILDELSLISFRRWHLEFLFFHKTCVESTKSMSTWHRHPCRYGIGWKPMPRVQISTDNPHHLLNSRLRNQLRTPHYANALRRFSAIFLNSAVTGDCLSSPTIGIPRSPASRVAISIGIWPSRGTRNRFASRSPPPLPKIS